MIRRNIDLLERTSLSLILAGTLLGAFIGLPSLTGFIYAQAPAADNRPNFLLITGDNFGYSYIRAFGSEISTPNLDPIAKDRKVLTDYHTAPSVFTQIDNNNNSSTFSANSVVGRKETTNRCIRLQWTVSGSINIW